MSDLESQKYQVEREIRSIENRIHEMVLEYRKKLTEESEPLRALKDRLLEIELNIDAQRRSRWSQTAKENAANPIIGMKVYLWAKPYSFLSNYDKTGIVGVFEVLDEETYRTCQRRGSYMVEVGDIVVRQLKKNGDRSKIYHTKLHVSEQVDWRDFWGWYPEGVDPNERSKEN